MPCKFKVGENVFMKVKPKKTSLKLRSCTKLVAIYCGPFYILYKIGPITQILALPIAIKVHNAFHVSLLNKYVHDHNHVIDWTLIQVEREGYFQVNQLCILDKHVIVLKNRVIGQVKVQWTHYNLEEVMWDLEDAMWEAYPHSF